MATKKYTTPNNPAMLFIDDTPNKGEASPAPANNTKIIVPEKKEGKSTRITAIIPKTLFNKLQATADALGVSRNEIVNQALQTILETEAE